MSNPAYIGLGSNLGDGKAILQDAWFALGEIDGITTEKLSSPYSTAPVDMASQHWFTNAVGRLQVNLEPLGLLQALLDVEVAFGRTRDDMVFGFQDRSLDLDLLYCGEIKMDSPELILPHPRIRERLFVLVPFVEIEPDYVDFSSGESITEMLDRLKKQLGESPRSKQEIIKSSWDL